MDFLQIDSAAGQVIVASEAESVFRSFKNTESDGDNDDVNGYNDDASDNGYGDGGHDGDVMVMVVMVVMVARTRIPQSCQRDCELLNCRGQEDLE